MAKDKAMGSSAFAPAQLFQMGQYKASQGRTVRLVTAIALGVVVGLSAWSLYAGLDASDYRSLALGVPIVLLFGGLWLSYRAVHVPKFADFLISVEAEMGKVSWPTQTELIRSSLVVIFFILSLAVTLFMFDLFWRTVFKFLGVVS